MRIRAVAGWAIVATLCMFAGACNKSNVDPNLPAITTQPVNTTAKVGSTATFTVVASGQGPLSYQWFVFAKAIKGATSASFTTPTLAASDNNSFYFVLVTNSIGSIESDEVLLTVTTTSPPPGGTGNTLGNANPSDVLTLHNDAARTGQYLGETLLTPTNVNSAKFGKLGTLMTDGQVDAQPLYASGVTLPSGDVKNVLYAASEHGSVYAFDAATGSVIWQTGLVGATEEPADWGGCGLVSFEGGITATPVIDRTRGPHGAIYVIANTKTATGPVTQKIHALDIATGAELFDGPKLIQASARPANNANSHTPESFDAEQYQTVAGLQLLNGKAYAAWRPNCTAVSNTGWVMGFDTTNLNPSGWLYLEPATDRDTSGLAAAGLTGDTSGNLYLFGHASGMNPVLNSAGVVVPASAGSAFLKLSTLNGLALANSSRTTASSSAPSVTADLIMAAGVIVLPDFTDDAGKVWHLALGAGFDGSIDVLSRDSLGGSGQQSTPIIQTIVGVVSPDGMPSALAFFDNTAYFAASGDSIKAFPIRAARLSNSAADQSGNALSISGAQLAVSANATTRAILWALEGNGTGILHAYDAADLSHELYNSTQAGNSRDGFEAAAGSVAPTIAGGKVFIATKNGIVVFGQMK